MADIHISSESSSQPEFELFYFISNRLFADCQAAAKVWSNFDGRIPKLSENSNKI
jgi:hypothetical protein